jgi:hypothetical protein
VRLYDAHRTSERSPVIISVLIRRLREGKDYADFRAAWLPDRGFGVPTRVVSGVGVEDPRDVITIGFTDLELEDAEEFLSRVAPQEQARHDRLAEVIEPDATRRFYLQVADDDLTDEPPTA